MSEGEVAELCSGIEAMTKTTTTTEEEASKKTTALVGDGKALTAEEVMIEGRKRWPQPPKITLNTISEDPAIGIVEDFLTGEETDYIIKMTESRGYVEAHTGTSSQGGMYDATEKGNPFGAFEVKKSKNRTGMVCLLEPEDDPLVQILMERVSYLAGCHVEQVECLSVVRYHEGQFFKEHHDGSFRPKTVFIYLNTIPLDAGGETYFKYVGYKFHPTRGLAVVWDNVTKDGKTADGRMIHEGLPVLGNHVKYGINCFINEKQVQKKLQSVIQRPVDS